MSRRAAVSLPLLVLVVAAASVPLWWRFLVAPVPAPAAVQGGPSSDAVDVGAFLRRAGIQPDHLAAAGVAAAAVGGLAQATSTYCGQHATAIPDADAAYLAAAQEVERLEDLVVSGRGSEADLPSLQAQRAALLVATSARTAAVQAVFDAAAAALPSTQREKLARIRSNQAWEIPVQFLVVERSERDWVNLRDALAAERYATERNLPLHPTAVQILAAARADAAVAQATVSVDTNLASITSAWNTATAD